MSSAPPAAGWRTARRTVPLSRAVIIGILNVTPDSFSDGGRHLALADALMAALAMKEEGADVLDVGGESTRPGAAYVDEDEELRRVIPVIERLASDVLLPISVDTRRSGVARCALAAGAEIVNDVSGLMRDPAMARVIAESGAGAIIMHMRGEPGDMDDHAVYSDVVGEVCAELAERRDAALAAGIEPERIVLDPGLGFAKKTEHNLALLAGLPELTALGHPLLVGPSRKRFLGQITGEAVNHRDHATASACVAARILGASLFRVHDVGTAREALTIADAVSAARRTPHAARF